MKGIYSGTINIILIPETFMLIAIVLFELSSGQTNQQTHKQTNATENITSLTSSAEVTTIHRRPYDSRSYILNRT